MSRAVTWIWIGIGLLVGGAVIAFFGVAVTSTPDGGTSGPLGFFLFLGGMAGLAGLFAIQVGVMALAVRIGTAELLEATRAGDGRPAPPPAHVPARTR